MKPTHCSDNRLTESDHPRVGLSRGHSISRKIRRPSYQAMRKVHIDDDMQRVLTLKRWAVALPSRATLRAKCCRGDLSRRQIGVLLVKNVVRF